jgi:hypothetical protein
VLPTDTPTPTASRTPTETGTGRIPRSRRHADGGSDRDDTLVPTARRHRRVADADRDGNGDGYPPTDTPTAPDRDGPAPDGYPTITDTPTERPTDLVRTDTPTRRCRGRPTDGDGDGYRPTIPDDHDTPTEPPWDGHATPTVADADRDGRRRYPLLTTVDDHRHADDHRRIRWS